MNNNILSQELLRYGKILFDEEFTEDYWMTIDTRIRIIKYQDKLYLHKMVNGEVIEVKELA